MTTPWRTLDPSVRRSVHLPPMGHLPEHDHLFEPRELWAIKGALGARRPLLVRGEPGTGKSELAWAAAELFGWPLVSFVVTSRAEPADLHWRFDAVARLAQAQLLNAAGATQTLESLEERRFVTPGPLWWVFDWEGAEKQHQAAAVKGARPNEPIPAWKDLPPEQRGTVLLIDEIDKADPDLPNGLLESLGNGQFQVPYIDEPVRCSRAHGPPLVVITTNEERELPAAFVRRCLVLQLGMPEGDGLEPWLVQRGRAHFDARCADAVYSRAAKLVIADRKALGASALVRPGQAEYLDLLRAVLEVAGEDADLQDAALEELQGFALRKNAPEAR